MKENSEGLPMQRIRDCVKSYLKSRGMTYRELAERMQLTERTVTNYLSSIPMSAKTVRRISEALDYPYDLLIRGEQYVDPKTREGLEERLRKLEEYCAALEKRIERFEKR